MVMSLVRTSGIFLLVLVSACGVFLLINNQEHANGRHLEAELVRATYYQDDLCSGEELWFSPSRGTILALCYIDELSQWGGVILQVTENNGTVLLSPEDAYERSAFSADRKYWNNVLKRDGYMALYLFPDVETLWKGGCWR